MTKNQGCSNWALALVSNLGRGGVDSLDEAKCGPMGEGLE